MWPVLEEAAVRVPALLIMCLVVLYFMKYLGKRDVIFAKSLKERDEALKENTKTFTKAVDKRDVQIKVMGDSCHEVQRDSIKAMNENSRVLGENLQVISRVTTVLEKIEHKSGIHRGV